MWNCRLYQWKERKRVKRVNKSNKISQTLARHYDDNNGIFNFMLVLFFENYFTGIYSSMPFRKISICVSRARLIRRGISSE